MSRESRITAIALLKSFYDEEVFTLLVKEIYSSDIDVSEAAIRASGSLGNEIAIPHLYQIIERGRSTQQIAAVQSLMAIRAPSSTGMLIKYFNHFAEEGLRTEILKAINAISPSDPQVLNLNQAAYADPKQGEAVKSIAAEELVEAERFTMLKETLPRALPEVQRSVFSRMLQTGGQEVPNVDSDTLAPAALGAYLCVYTLKTRNPQGNFVLETLQKGDRETILSFLQCLSDFQGRLRFPTRVFRLLLIMPYVDRETETLVGDFLKKIVIEVKSASPHFLSEFSVIASAHLDTVFGKVRKSYISLRGITNKDDLLATVLATIIERYATPSILADVQAFFKDETTGRTPPVAQIRSLLASAPKEDQNRFDACIPLFTLTEKKDRLTVFNQLSRVDLGRPFFLRRLNRLVRVAGALEIKTASKKIQELLDFARAERIQFLEETCIVTLCQLLTRSSIETSREYFKDPTRNLRSLDGYIRGARFIPARIMVGPLIHILQNPALNAQSRALALETLECLDLEGLQRVLPSLLKVLDLPSVPDADKLRVGDLIARYADATIAPLAMDLTGHAAPAGRRVAVRILKSLAARGTGAPADIVTNRLYLLLEDADRSVRVEALIALLSVSDDYASQIVADYVQTGDASMVADILRGLSKPLSRDVFALVLGMIPMDSLPVQDALRQLLPELSQGAYAEELRQSLVALLTVVPGGDAKKTDTAEAVAAALPQTESALDQAKLEFKFRRENTQVLTVFFIDIAGYTEKSSKIDMSSLLKLIKTFEDIVTAEIEANRGSIVKKMGDGILAVFKHPLNATVAALSIQQKIHDYSAVRVEQEKFQTRIGLNTGPVIRRENDIFGEVVNVASRMQSAATPGDVLLTEATFKEISDYVRCTELGRIQVKGIKEGVVAYSPEEVTVDLSKLKEAPGQASSAPGALRDSSLEKLKQSMFVPDFSIPPETGARETAGFFKSLFSDLTRAVEDIASDYHDEYEFKRYLQAKWNSLMGKL
ncbi:MAG TPA: adenylate/guanylate cyclase domain-containing protein [Spirochaetia bacterium]